MSRPFNPVPKPVKQDKAKPKGIAQRSKKRAAQERLYAKERIKYLDANPVCEGQLTGCTYLATCIQHSEGRIGELLTDVTKFKASCHNCNMRAETHPTESIAKGFSVSRLK
jgi:hypothetical protein